MKRTAILLLALMLALLPCLAAVQAEQEEEKLCKAKYFTQLKSSATPKKMIGDGQASFFAAILWLEVDSYYEEKYGDSTDVLALLKRPRIDFLNDRPIYAGLDKSGNGYAAYPMFGGGYDVYALKKKQVYYIAHYGDDDLAKFLKTLKSTDLVDNSYFYGSYQGVSEAFGK